MHPPNSDLHGNAPDSCRAALLIIDMVNDLHFPEGPRLLQPALAAAHRISELKQRARGLGIPVVYANDNFGHWRSDLPRLVRHCLRDGVQGRPLVELLRPDEQDYFVLKPKHSAFFATPLDLLLTHLGCERLVLTGLATDVCVQFTAQDAYLRSFKLAVPSDCVAAHRPQHTRSALSYMRRVLSADTTPSAQLDLRKLL